MKQQIPMAFITIVGGLVSAILTYYSLTLQGLNPSQLKKLFDVDRENDRYGGMKPSQVVMGIHLAALCLELMFLAALLLFFQGNAFDLKSFFSFLGVGILFEIITRIYIPAGFPMSERQKLLHFERYLFLFLGYVMYLPAFLFEKITRTTRALFFPKTDDERMTEAEETIKSIIDVGEKEGIFRSEEGELLQSIVEFSETVVKEVMTPRIDLQCISIEKSIDEFIAQVVQTGYSKIPVYKDRIDNIEGILYAKDVLKYWGEDQHNISLKEMIRPAYFVPETKKVRNLLREFQKEKMHMAIVVDEYGGVAGVVTIEDLLEEIVGEIHDEYDVERELIRQIGPERWLVDARVDLDELSEIVGVQFPEEGYETLGGFLFDRLGRIPSRGEVLDYENIEIEIKDANDRRILKTIVRRIRDQDAEQDGRSDGV